MGQNIQLLTIMNENGFKLFDSTVERRHSAIALAAVAMFTINLILGGGWCELASGARR